MELIKFNKDNFFQRLKAWYIDEESVTLTEVEEKKKDRLLHAWSLRIKDKYSKHQVIKIIQREHNISAPTAYRDYLLAQEIFGHLDKVNIDAERIFLAESYLDLYRKSMKKKNYDGARKALDSYKALFDFGEKEQTIDPKKLEASVYKLILPRGTSKILNQMFDGGSVDFNALNYDDAEWSSVDENEEEVNEDE